MANNSSKDPALSLTAVLQNRRIEKETSPAEKIVIQDECGDSLWDDVLSQEKESSSEKVSIANDDIKDTKISKN